MTRHFFKLTAACDTLMDFLAANKTGQDPFSAIILPELLSRISIQNGPGEICRDLGMLCVSSFGSTRLSPPPQGGRHLDKARRFGGGCGQAETGSWALGPAACQEVSESGVLRAEAQPGVGSPVL